ncbi:MAG: CARDB domain-containing protein [Halobacteriales archaeon]|nr:CARDB domain-containing protein [Halobacteriales archaeon]
MAAPHVAGATALALSASGSQSPEDVREAFSLTASGSGSGEPDTRKGHGSADALAVTEHLLDDASVSGSVVDNSGATVSDAEVRVNGVRVDDTDGSYQVGLAQGSWSVEANAPGYDEVTETVSLAQNENAQKDIVLGETEPAFFEVTSLNGPSSAQTEGGMTVSATVTNTGDASGTQDVTLRISDDGTLDDTAVVAQNQLSLGGGESSNVEFTVGTPNTEGGYSYGIFTDDDSETDSLTVEDIETAVFGVDNLNGPSSAETGQTVTVTATVRNDGEQEGTKDVTLRLADEGETLDDETVVETRNDLTLDAEETKTVGFSFETPGSEGSYGYGVFTEDGSLTDTMTVENTEPAFFEVRQVRTDEEVVAGQPFTANATVENTGDVTDTQDIELLLDGEVEDSRTESLSGGDTVVVEFRGISVTNPGSLDVTFATDDDSSTSTVDVLAPAFFEVEDLSPTTAAVERGKEVTVTANVTNTGEVGATETVGIYLDGEEVGNRTVSLASGKTENVSFGITAPAETGEHSYSIRTADTEITGTLISEEPLLESPTLDVSDELWTAVTGQDGDAGNLSLADLGDVITAYQSNPDDAELDGAEITLADIGSLIRYYRSEV